MSKEKKTVKEFKLPSWNEIPSIELYLDQIISLVDGYFQNLIPTDDDEPVLTKTMVNNYVKHQVIAAPVKKKYCKNSVCSLIAICILKTVYSMSDIAVLLRSAISLGTEEETYTSFCTCIERAVACAFSGETFQELYPNSEYPYLMQNIAQSFADKLYVLEYTKSLREKFATEESETENAKADKSEKPTK